jgi:hypothetical protein
VILWWPMPRGQAGLNQHRPYMWGSLYTGHISKSKETGTLILIKLYTTEYMKCSYLSVLTSISIHKLDIIQLFGICGVTSSTSGRPFFPGGPHGRITEHPVCTQVSGIHLVTVHAFTCAFI